MIQYKEQSAGPAKDLEENKAGYYCDVCLCEFSDKCQIQIGADDEGFVLVLCDNCWDATQIPTDDGFSSWKTGCGLKKKDIPGDRVSTIWDSDSDLCQAGCYCMLNVKP